MSSKRKTTKRKIHHTRGGYGLSELLNDVKDVSGVIKTVGNTEKEDKKDEDKKDGEEKKKKEKITPSFIENVLSNDELVQVSYNGDLIEVPKSIIPDTWKRRKRMGVNGAILLGSIGGLYGTYKIVYPIAKQVYDIIIPADPKGEKITRHKTAAYFNPYNWFKHPSSV